MARQVCLPVYPPNRIVSLVPSQTELICDLGLTNKLAGITRFCIHPAYLRKQVPIIGGTKRFDFEKIRQLKPDLIIGNKEENYPEGIALLEQEFPVVMTDIVSIEEAIAMVELTGLATRTQFRAEKLIADLKLLLTSFRPATKRLHVLYLIWKKPWMAAGTKTFIHSMLSLCGFENAVQTERYPSFSEEELSNLNPNLVFLSSEPFPFSEKHKEEVQRIFPSAAVHLVNGEWFSWYGSRLLPAIPQLQELTDRVGRGME